MFWPFSTNLDYNIEGRRKIKVAYRFARIRPGDEAFALEERSYAKAENFRASLENLRAHPGGNWQNAVANYNVILCRFDIPKIEI